MSGMSLRSRALIVSTLAAVALSGCTPAKQAATGAQAAPTDAGPAQPKGSASPAAAPTKAPAFPPEYRRDVKAGAGDDFTVFRRRVDPGGATHVRFTRTYHGIPVYGGDVVLHLDGNGAVRGASNSLAAPLTLGTTPTVSGNAAQASARTAFSGRIAQVKPPRLIVDAATGSGRLAWESQIVGVGRDGQTPSRLHVLTDAQTGAILGSWDEVETVIGTGKSNYSGTVRVDTTGVTGFYRMSDPSHGRNTVCDLKHATDGFCAQYTDKDNVWDADPAAVDAYYGAAVTFDYYKNVLGRDGVFDNGQGVLARVHFGDKVDNAYWDGEQMNYGDGPDNAHPLTALDIAGHEMSHGVTQHSVSGGLTYSGESGGLNEATSDIFGTMVEFYANNPNDPPDYLLGEQLGTPLRYLFNPSLDGSSPSCWSTTTKNLNVHFSSGVGNHFFFDLAEGTGKTRYGTSPSCTHTSVIGIGRDKAAKIWYRALDVYFTSSTSYVNPENPGNTARAYTLKAAADLYGACGTEYRAVQRAWTAVNVAGPDAACK